MKQLYMIRHRAPVVPRSLPEGYAFAFFRGSEEEITDWLAACVGIVGENPERGVFDSSILNCDRVHPATDLIFVTDPKGKRVATITVAAREDGNGYLHMVGACPEVRGNGIGQAMVSYACEILEARGHSYSTLSTDDHRLSAIKTYLDHGFRPLICHDPESDVGARWDAVLKALGYREVERFDEERISGK